VLDGVEGSASATLKMSTWCDTTWCSGLCGRTTAMAVRSSSCRWSWAMRDSVCRCWEAAIKPISKPQ